MSVWGKILGGAAGFALGGPIGALLGGLAGHAVDKMRAGAEGGDGTKQIAFTIGVVVLGAKMAKADGVVTPDEIVAFRQVFRVPPEEMKNVGRVFDRARQDAEGFEPYARQIAGLFKGNPAVLEDLLDGLFHIAKCAAIASNLFSAVTNGNPVILAISFATFLANPGLVLRPVPTAVPPCASS